MAAGVGTSRTEEPVTRSGGSGCAGTGQYAGFAAHAGRSSAAGDGDGWVYPFTVVSALGARVQVAEGPGMSYDAATQHLRLTAFPQREHMGLVRVRWP